jgi:hypothetical protein
MKFYFDENLGIQLSNGLREFGEDTCHSRDCSFNGVADDIWLRYVGDQGWFLITVDRRIRRRPLEKEALIQHKVGAFFLLGKSMSRWAYVEQLVRSWNRIKEIAARERRPFAYSISNRGTQILRMPL